MRLELTRVGLLVQLANHYTTRGAYHVIYYALLSNDTRLKSLGFSVRIELTNIGLLIWIANHCTIFFFFSFFFFFFFLPFCHLEDVYSYVYEVLRDY